MTFRFKMHTAQDLDGFIKILTANGYQVNFRTGGNARVIMCDVLDDKCIIRNKAQDIIEYWNDESEDDLK